MVVEDDDDVRTSLEAVLGDEGFDVITAVNGADALARLGRDRLPDVILLDLMMPTSDGYQFRAAQRTDPRLAPIPVIAMTAGGRDVVRLDELAVAGFLRKPFELDELLRMIATVGRR